MMGTALPHCRVPSPAVVLTATHPDAQTSTQLEAEFGLTRSLKSTVAALSSSFCRISMCPSSEERCRAVRWNWGTGWHVGRWMHPPLPSLVVPPALSQGSQPSHHRHGGAWLQDLVAWHRWGATSGC